MVQSVLLIETDGAPQKNLGSVSLSNAKQLVIGRLGDGCVILHVAANSAADIGKAVLDFSQVAGVSGVLTLAIRIQK